MSDGLSDLRIVRGLRSGDREAWEALYRKYSERVWRYVAKLVGGDDERVADVFQETMLAAARNGRTLSEETTLWAWLSRIGHNRAAFYWRQRYRDQTTAIRNDSLATASSSDPAEVFSRVEQIESVRRLLAEMDPEHVALLTAKYMDELTVSQIVDSLGGTSGSVRGKLERARQDFRQRFTRATSRGAIPVSEDAPLGEGDS